ncbi:hypothetical protein MVEN_01331300 [Mycena venus]|uniref:Transmembrane protein n=1 Tax=Mycena venus TaxID=2733690 RepID=A0A8H6XZ45_9AGAR|nr:hypothetical protein MVEN_01331300 [Mycena venus]
MIAILRAEPGTGAQRIILLDYGHLIGLTILYFDHLISLGTNKSIYSSRFPKNSFADTEINLLWRRRKSLSAYWFYINRYFGFFSGISVSALPFLTLSSEACKHYSFFRETVIVATQVIAGIIMVIRVYALYGRDWRILWSMLGIGGISFGRLLGGNYSLALDSIRLILIFCWLDKGLFIFDTVIFALTVYNAYRTRRSMIPSPNLYTLVVRDGAMYFGIMALSNLANIASYYFSGPILPGSLATFASCVSITMISRMILNLHEHANIGILSETTHHVVQNNIPLGSQADIPMIMTDSELHFNAQLYSVNSGVVRPVEGDQA